MKQLIFHVPKNQKLSASICLSASQCGFHPVSRWRTSRRPCLESAASTLGMSRSPWEREPSWTSTPAASPIHQWQVTEPCTHTCTHTHLHPSFLQDDRSSASLQVCILSWGGRSAQRWCTWRREMQPTQAPPSDGRRS